MSKKATSIVFTGDIGFDRYMDRKWEDEQLLSKELLDFFHSADHVCASVEGALINAEDDGSRGIFFHSMNPEATAMYKKNRCRSLGHWQQSFYGCRCRRCHQY